MQYAISVAIADSDWHTIDKTIQAVRGYVSNVTAFPSLRSLLDTPVKTAMDVIVLSLEQPFEETFELVPKLKIQLPNAEVIFVTRFNDKVLWVEAMQRGAYELLPKPIDASELGRAILHAVERHRGELQQFGRCFG